MSHRRSRRATTRLLLGAVVALLAAVAAGAGVRTPAGSPAPSATGGATPSAVASPAAEPSDPRLLQEPNWDHTHECEDFAPDIEGDDGPNVIKGTPADEIICGHGGDDIIDGGGGNDSIFGGEGDDHIVGGPENRDTLCCPVLVGDEGDDVIVVAGDEPYATAFLYGEDGDDVLLGGVTAQFQRLHGGAGNDIMVAPPLTGLAGNVVNGGDGNDVAVALNFSHFTMADEIDLDGRSDVSVPVGKWCKVTAQLDFSSPGSHGSVTCQLPWPPVLSGLDPFIDLTATVDDEGELSVGAELAEGLASISVDNLRQMARGQAAELSGDMCICDPPKDPDHPEWPHDNHDYLSLG